MCAPFVSSYEPAPSLSATRCPTPRGLDPEVSDVPVGDQAASQERLAFALDCHAAFFGYSQVDLPVGAAAGKIGLSGAGHHHYAGCAYDR